MPRFSRSVILVLAIAVAAPAATLAGTLETSYLSGDTPQYPMPPYTYHGSRSVGVIFATTPEALRAMVPEPLEPNERGIAYLIVAEQRVVKPIEGTYLEVILSIPVSYGETAGSYMPVLYLDDPMAIIVGREVYGYAKIEAEISWTETNDGIEIEVTRKGAKLIGLSVALGEPIEQIPQEAPAPSFNLKLIPSVTAGAAPDVKQLTATTLQDQVVTLMRPAVAKLELASSAYDPLGEIPVLSVVGAAYSERSFVLDFGKVVHDYLMNP